jgi:hypothetical protein
MAAPICLQHLPQHEVLRTKLSILLGLLDQVCAEGCFYFFLYGQYRGLLSEEIS